MMGVVVQLVLIGVLAACAISLRTQLDATRSGITIERSRAAISERLVLTSVARVDVRGTAHESPPARANRFVVAGFRSSTIDQDISLWTAVAALLTNEPDIHIVAYCDDARCADAAMKRPPLSRVTVLRYAEASNSQAVLYADGRGDCLVLSPEMKTLRRVTWRTPGRLAEDIAREVRQ